MILYKSIASVKEYRDYIKDRMKQARNSSAIHSKVSTVNTKYKQCRHSSLTSMKDSASSKDLIANKSVKKNKTPIK